MGGLSTTATVIIIIFAVIILLIFYGIGVSGLSFCSFLFAFATQKYGGSVTAAYIIFALNVLVAISFLILRFIKLSNYKLHIGFASVNVALNLLIDFLYLFFFTNSHVVFLRTPNIGVEIACFIIILALLVFIFVLLLNPSYKQWIKMVKIDAETFSRPKKNYLVIIEKKNEVKESEDRLLQREKNLDKRDEIMQNREKGLEEREKNLLKRIKKEPWISRFFYC